MRKPDDKPHSTFLKLIIGYKTVAGIFELILSVALIKFLGQDLSEVVTRLAERLNLDIDNYFVDAAIEKAGMIGNDTFIGITLIIFIFGVFNLVESWGLHLKRRWAEWLTVIATSALIPFEIYEIIKEISTFKIVVLVINCLIVYYLAKHKELFKSRKEAVRPL